MRAKLTRLLARLPATVWAGLGAALAAWAIAQTGAWRELELRLFDMLVARSAPNKVALPITIVGIDERTFEALDASWPLARRHHARLLEHLKEAGVAVVAFDILFAGASGPQDDAPFAEAIRAAGRVVLASDYVFREDAAVRQWLRVDPHPMFRAAGARHGHAPFAVDADAVLRRVPTVGDALWRVVLEELAKDNPGVVALDTATDDMRIRWLGPPHTFAYVPFYALLEPEKHLPPDWRELLRDNIVLVGRNLNVIGEVGAAAAEMYRTPFFPVTREFMPRVEAHANLIANMASGSVLREAPASWRHGTLALAALAGGAAMWRWHPVRSGVALAALLAALGAGWYALFARMQLWLPAAGAALAPALIYVSQAGLAFFAGQRERARLRGAFAMYLSPALVEEVMARPAGLRLGGERRVITILFSDLAGFTPVAERLAPEEVARIVNRHHSEMTDAIMDHGGMVQKFLGDGILAYFGAPVADERQAGRAVRAALEMQRRMAPLAAELAVSRHAELAMRIGIHRGECVVGNMGSSRRFDYAAVGDPVNLASRLEGANKVYGTPILVSEAVAEAAGPELRFREVDRIRVKGRTGGVAVYTPCEDALLVAASADALAAWRAGDLDAAEAAWKRILEAHPGDAVAALFLARLAVLRAQGLPADWDGITVLEAK